jgi:hypothetical protein
MPINWSAALYSLEQDTFGRPVSFTSTAGNSFTGLKRGIYSSTEMDIALEDGSIITDQRTILDILDIDFPAGQLPVQDDTINIPAEPISGLPALGDFQVTDVYHNGGGEWTLQLKKIMTA